MYKFIYSKYIMEFEICFQEAIEEGWEIDGKTMKDVNGFIWQRLKRPQDPILETIDSTLESDRSPCEESAEDIFFDDTHQGR